MPQDKFANTESVTSPAREAFVILPSDTQQLPQVPKAIYVGTGGDLRARLVDGTAEVTFRNISNGAILDIRPAAIFMSGTSAADIVGLA